MWSRPEGRLVSVDKQIAVDAARRQLTDRLRHLGLQIFEQRELEDMRKSHVKLPGSERQYRRRRIFYDRIFDAVEKRPILLPVI